MIRNLMLLSSLLSIVACGQNNFEINDSLSSLAPRESSEVTDYDSLQSEFVAIEDMLVHHSQVDQSDLQKFFPNAYKRSLSEVGTSGVFKDGIVKWPSGVLPMVFSNLSTSQISTIKRYCSDLSKYAKVKCVDRTTQANYIRVVGVPNLKCGNSYLGKIGGRQDLNLGTSAECFSERVIQHEIMHALGIAHEQNRQDRDQFVKINWDNIVPGQEHNFARIKVNTTRTESYDFDSIMHYASFSFSKASGLYTIVRKQPVYLAPSNCQYPNPSYPPSVCNNGGNTNLVGYNRVLSNNDKQILKLGYGASPFYSITVSQFYHLLDTSVLRSKIDLTDIYNFTATMNVNKQGMGTLIKTPLSKNEDTLIHRVKGRAAASIINLIQ